MRYPKFGPTGMDVSVICLGCMSFGDPSRGRAAWSLPEAESRELIKQALEAGINFFDIVRAGKARYIGASSMFAWQFAKALAVSEQRGWARFVSMQDRYNLLYREEEREMLPLCASEDIAVIPWSPLARGRLTRPWDADTARSEKDEFGASLYRDEDEQIVARTLEVAERLGRSPAQVAMAWLLSNPAVTAPIVGVTKSQHLADAIDAVDLELSDEDIAALEEPYRPHPIAGHV